MRVRFYWRNCEYQGQNWHAGPVDAFWVEATEQEARTSVFPAMMPCQIEESYRLVAQYGRAAAAIGNSECPFCYLVARDLSSLAPLPPHYPVHQLWNAYSPFERMSEVTVDDLTDLQSITLPHDDAT
jgi:hypothetical protein